MSTSASNTTLVAPENDETARRVSIHHHLSMTTGVRDPSGISFFSLSFNYADIYLHLINSLRVHPYHHHHHKGTTHPGCHRRSVHVHATSATSLDSEMVIFYSVFYI